jgi:hypothetical protein
MAKAAKPPYYAMNPDRQKEQKHARMRGQKEHHQKWKLRTYNNTTKHPFEENDHPQPHKSRYYRTTHIGLYNTTTHQQRDESRQAICKNAGAKRAPPRMENAHIQEHHDDPIQGK